MEGERGKTRELTRWMDECEGKVGCRKQGRVKERDRGTDKQGEKEDW